MASITAIRPPLPTTVAVVRGVCSGTDGRNAIREVRGGIDEEGASEEERCRSRCGCPVRRRIARSTGLTLPPDDGIVVVGGRAGRMNRGRPREPRDGGRAI